MNAAMNDRFTRLLVGAVLLVGSAGTLSATPVAASGQIQTRPLADGADKKDSKKDDAPQGDPVDIDKLPKAVVNGLKKAMPGSRIVKAAKLPDGNYFLDDVKVGKREYDVTISPDGKILKSVEQQDN